MSRQQSIDSTPTHPRDALITSSAAVQLELRQNNPQDCSNLIAASVDRATVEISRTIIRLNATFSQQLDQARISASNGIKSAQDSATSTIQIVVQSASVATSSAFSSVRIANLAVTSANAALTSATNALNTANLAVTSANSALDSATQALTTANFALTSALSASNSEVLRLSSSSSSDVFRLSSASSSEVARLSASLSLAEASLAAVRGGLVTSNNPQGPPTFVLSLNAAQIAGIVVGGVVVSILLGVAAGFLIIRIRRSRRSKQLDEKNGPSNSTDPPARPPSTHKKHEKKVRQVTPSSVIENPFLSPEELASAQTDGGSRSESENDISSVILQKSLKPDDSPAALIEEKPRRNFSLPRTKDGRKRLSPKTPKPEPEPQAGAKDWTDIAEARQQAKKEASREPPAQILKVATDTVEQTRKLATANPFEDVAAIDTKAQGEQLRGADRRYVSPLRRNPVVKVFEDDEPLPPLPSSLNKQRAVSPLRRNPVLYSPTEEEPVPPLPPLQPLPDKQRAMSPLRRNPVIRMPPEEDPVPPLPPSPPSPPPPVLAERRRTSPVPPPVLEQQQQTPPVAPPPPPVLEERPGTPPLPLPPSPIIEKRQRMSPVRPIAIDTSPEVQEPVLPVPSSILETQNSSPLESNLVFQTYEESEPPSPLDLTATLPTPRESVEELSPLKATMSLLSEIESLMSDANELRDVSPVRNSASSQTKNSLRIQSEINSNLEEARETERPQVAVIGYTSDEDTEEQPDEYSDQVSEAGDTERPQVAVIEYTSDEDTEEQPDEYSDQVSEAGDTERPQVAVIEYTPDEDTEEQPDEYSDQVSEAESKEAEEAPEVDERAARGRSMIRTSDIIEARLSAIARARAEAKVPDIVREEEEFSEDSLLSSVATSPEPSPGPSRAERPESPPRKNTSVVLKSNPLAFRAKPKPTALLRPAQAQSKAESNAQFSQAFLMFKSLDSKNPQNSAAAFSEVNHRALAGIHVPASLREQAVRNLSKSRERGKSRARE